MAGEITTEEENDSALEELDRLLAIDPDPELGTPMWDRVNSLMFRIRRFEEKTYHFDIPEAVDMIEFMMDQMQLAPEDMVTYFGSVESLNEVLERRRELTLDEIRALHNGLGIPAEVLIRKPAPPEAVAA